MHLCTDFRLIFLTWRDSYGIKAKMLQSWISSRISNSFAISGPNPDHTIYLEANNIAELTEEVFRPMLEVLALGDGLIDLWGGLQGLQNPYLTLSSSSFLEFFCFISRQSYQLRMQYGLDSDRPELFCERSRLLPRWQFLQRFESWRLREVLSREESTNARRVLHLDWFRLSLTWTQAK